MIYPSLFQKDMKKQAAASINKNALCEKRISCFHQGFLLYVICEFAYYKLIITQGDSLVYHLQLVAVYHQDKVLHIIIAKAIQPSVDEMRLRR